MNETIFLSPRQALDAVCMDFRRYAPQVMLFSEILRVISRPGHFRARIRIAAKQAYTLKPAWRRSPTDSAEIAANS